MKDSIRKLCIGIGWLACVSSPALAQELQVGVARMWTDHELLGDPFGIDAAVGVQPFGRVGVRVGVEIYQDDSRGFGSTCVGLIPPGVDCSEEPRRDEAGIAALGLTVPVILASGRRVDVALLPSVRMAWVESVQVGLESGRTRGADRTMFGYGMGVEAAVAPIVHGPLRLRLSGHAGALHSFGVERVADGYTPFNGRIGVFRTRLAVSLVL